jgi:hypothetical protein
VFPLVKATRAASTPSNSFSIHRIQALIAFILLVHAMQDANQISSHCSSFDSFNRATNSCYFLSGTHAAASTREGERGFGSTGDVDHEPKLSHAHACKKLHAPITTTTSPSCALAAGRDDAHDIADANTDDCKHVEA